MVARPKSLHRRTHAASLTILCIIRRVIARRSACCSLTDITSGVSAWASQVHTTAAREIETFHAFSGCDYAPKCDPPCQCRSIVCRAGRRPHLTRLHDQAPVNNWTAACSDFLTSSSTYFAINVAISRRKRGRRRATNIVGIVNLPTRNAQAVHRRSKFALLQKADADRVTVGNVAMDKAIDPLALDLESMGRPLVGEEIFVDRLVNNRPGAPTTVAMRSMEAIKNMPGVIAARLISQGSTDEIGRCAAGRATTTHWRRRGRLGATTRRCAG